MIVARALARSDFKIQSILSKSVFWTGSKCPSEGDVLLIESNKGSKERQGPTVGVNLAEVSVWRGRL